MMELNTLEEKEREKIEDLLTSLEKKKNEIIVHKTTLLNIRQYASEFQTFFSHQTDGKQLDIAFIPKDNTIAATSGGDGSHKIIIIDMKTRKFSRLISVTYSYYEVAYNDSNLITCARFKGLNILTNGSSEVINEIKIKEMSSFSYVAAFDKVLYCTNRAHRTVTCSDITGTEVWTFKDESVMKFPRGITVDDDGNVYIVNQSSHSVIGISSDGKRCLDLLNAKDGLYNPKVLYYDRSTNQLLVGNESETALLFQVESKT
ncbi:unnamed protein product [Mytilus coruscus]|uniref:Uncharacterized protein n=1 Tax=Mytilus coruscus TaxID=42192 RepID=A0A6J8D7I3_MYTCO|nr:unnamed protein product [Mytilus coruscus]